MRAGTHTFHISEWQRIKSETFNLCWLNFSIWALLKLVCLFISQTFLWLCSILQTSRRKKMEGWILSFCISACFIQAPRKSVFFVVCFSLRFHKQIKYIMCAWTFLIQIAFCTFVVFPQHVPNFLYFPIYYYSGKVPAFKLDSCQQTLVSWFPRAFKWSVAFDERRKRT